MIAALYARKSTDDSDRNAVARSTSSRLTARRPTPRRRAGRSTRAICSSTITPAPSGSLHPASVPSSPRFGDDDPDDE